MSLVIRAADANEHERVEQILEQLWGSVMVISRGQVTDAGRSPAFVAVRAEEIIGLATYELRGAECELLSLDALHPHQGVGTALLARVAHAAAEHGCRRLWLITSNDNLDALRFYQRRGLRLVAVHRGAIDEARRVKPSIPDLGEHGIPIHDELELELVLDGRSPGTARP